MNLFPKMHSRKFIRDMTGVRGPLARPTPTPIPTGIPGLSGIPVRRKPTLGSGLAVSPLGVKLFTGKQMLSVKKLRLF